jgi:hypothetical protein
VFHMRHELNFHILFRRNSAFEGLSVPKTSLKVLRDKIVM